VGDRERGNEERRCGGEDLGRTWLQDKRSEPSDAAIWLGHVKPAPGSQILDSSSAGPSTPGVNGSGSGKAGMHNEQEKKKKRQGYPLLLDLTASKGQGGREGSAKGARHVSRA